MPINSASIPALRVARAVKRKRRAEGGPVWGDIGGAMPEAYAEAPRIVKRLTGTQTGEPRYQMWPEKMVRSGTTLAGDMLSGDQQVLPPGLRREDYTDAPAPSEPTQDSTWLGRTLGMPPMSAQPNDPMMERAQDMAGMAGGQTLLTGAREAAPAAQRALVAADSQATGAPLAALEHIKTPQFKKWFGDSAAVDESGAPLVLYHGSNKGFSKFEHRPSFRQDEHGYKYETTPAAFFFTPEKDTARMFAKDRVLIDKNLRGGSGGHAQTREFYLSTKNPLDFTIDDATHQALREEGRYFVRQHEPNPYAAEIIGDITGYDPPQTWREVQQALDDPKIVSALKDQGFDGAKLAEEGGAESWAVFDPHQIKSPKNKGTFDPNNPSVLREDASAGAPLAGAQNDNDLVASLLAEQEGRKKPKKSPMSVSERKSTGGAAVNNPAMKIARSVRRANGGKVHVGPIIGDTDGRADKVPMEVPDGSYILTSDHVSSMGEGNTLAGFRKLKKMFPKSVTAYKEAKARGPTHRARGGRVPILAADGEFAICPADILDRYGSLDEGHRILDHWQTTERKNHIKTLSKLAPPAQD